MLLNSINVYKIIKNQIYKRAKHLIMCINSTNDSIQNLMKRNFSTKAKIFKQPTKFIIKINFILLINLKKI